MMDIYKVVFIGLASSFTILLIKKDSPEFTVFISVACGVIILSLVVPQLLLVIDLLKKISSQISYDFAYLNILLKIIGIAYISEFAMQLCSDAGQEAIAKKIELAGKVLIMVISSPILLTLLDMIIAMN